MQEELKLLDIKQKLNQLALEKKPVNPELLREWASDIEDTLRGIQKRLSDRDEDFALLLDVVGNLVHSRKDGMEYSILLHKKANALRCFDTVDEVWLNTCLICNHPYDDCVQRNFRCHSELRG